MNTIRSAFSAVATIDGNPVGQHTLIRRFMKAVFLGKTIFSQTSFYLGSRCLHLIRGIGPNSNLSLLQLSRKLLMLMFLVSKQCGQTLHYLDFQNMTVSDTKVSFRIGDLSKNLLSREPPLRSLSFLKPMNQTSFLCVYTAIRSFLDRTRETRSSTTRFFVTTKNPVTLASCDIFV